MGTCQNILYMQHLIYLILFYSVVAGLRVITMQCLAASLIGAHCETACTNPGDKYPHAALLLVAL